MSNRARMTGNEELNNTPSVGIFFSVQHKLWLDMTPLSQAGSYGEFRIHERGHDEYWELLIKQGAVPSHSEYEEYPRGRVAFNERTQQFSLLADRCILRQKEGVAEIIKRMHLPAERTVTGTDPHYECPGCQRNQ
jgi:hypothetical protein